MRTRKRWWLKVALAAAVVLLGCLFALQFLLNDWRAVNLYAQLNALVTELHPRYPELKAVKAGSRVYISGSVPTDADKESIRRAVMERFLQSLDADEVVAKVRVVPAS
jgi:hypothetical protein